jgi:hypothetical protein
MIHSLFLPHALSLSVGISFLLFWTHKRCSKPGLIRDDHLRLHRVAFSCHWKLMMGSTGAHSSLSNPELPPPTSAPLSATDDDPGSSSHVLQEKDADKRSTNGEPGSPYIHLLVLVHGILSRYARCNPYIHTHQTHTCHSYDHTHISIHPSIHLFKTDIPTYICAYVCIHPFLNILLCVCMCSCIYVDFFMCFFSLRIRTPTYVSICRYIRLCLCVYLFMCIFLCICMFSSLCIYTCLPNVRAYIHTYSYVYCSNMYVRCLYVFGFCGIISVVHDYISRNFMTFDQVDLQSSDLVDYLQNCIKYMCSFYRWWCLQSEWLEICYKWIEETIEQFISDLRWVPLFHIVMCHHISSDLYHILLSAVSASFNTECN